MSGWAAKRFWKSVSVIERDDGYGIALDGRPVKTPAKRPLVTPTRALAEAIAAEWDAQDGTIDPRGMPFTRTGNAAIDKVAPQHSAVADMLANYGDSDLLCYRAERPEALVQRQTDQWDPLLNWAADTLNAQLKTRAGVMHQPQDAAELDTLRARVHAFSPYELAAFHDLVSLSGSLILGFAATHDVADPDELWTISRLDEIWQSEQWGKDHEAEDMAERKRSAFLHAKKVFDLCGTS
jgi:chaperone required for assembly of F1-ATPase